jgi:hypothetical protein
VSRSLSHIYILTSIDYLRQYFLYNNPLYTCSRLITYQYIDSLAKPLDIE